MKPWFSIYEYEALVLDFSPASPFFFSISLFIKDIGRLSYKLPSNLVHVKFCHIKHKRKKSIGDGVY